MIKRVKNNSKTAAPEIVVAMATTPVDSSVGTAINMDDLDALLADDALAALEAEDDAEIELEAEDDIDLDALIDDEPAAVEAEPEVEAQPAAAELEVDEADLEKAVAAIEIEEARAEAYAGQESTTELNEPAPIEPKEKKAKAPKEPKERAPRLTVNDLPADAFVLTLTDDEDNLEGNKADVIARRPSAKKVAEKFDNTLLAIHAGKLPSVYTVFTLKALRAAGGSITSKQLVEQMMTCYKDGTARAQANQMFTLLPALKIADRTANVLTLKDDSVLAMAIFSLIDEGAAATAE